MHVDQEWVCLWQSEIFYTETQYKTDTLMDKRKRDKPHSSERFLNFRHTVLLLGVHETVGIV